MRAPSDRRRERAGARRLLAALALMLAAVAAVPAASADDGSRIAALSASMGSGHSERERIAACTALARLNDKSALRPLVAALKDSSPTVRGIAAVGLGKLGHKAALPALRAAQGDTDAVVQKRAAEAIVQICTVNNLPVQAAPTTTAATPTPTPTPAVADSAAVKVAAARMTAAAKAGFGTQPRAVAPRPALFVVIKSVSDDSPGKHDKKARKVHADALRAAMSTELASDAMVTLAAADAKKFGLDARHLDVSVVSLDLRTDGSYVECEAQLRLAISDDNGRMLSFVSGGAKVQVPRRGYDASYLPQLRREALENALRGLFGKLIDQLKTSLTS